MEARVGADLLAAVRNENASLAIYVIVRASDDLPLFAGAHLEPLLGYAERLGRDPRIADVNSPFTLQEAWPG